MTKQAKASSGSGPLSRRAFLGKTGVTLSALVASSLCASVAHGSAQASSTEESFGEAPAILIDLSRCVGCESCVLACKESNNLPQPDVAPDGLSKDAFAYVSRSTVVNAEGETVNRFAKRQCMHCLEPACVAACPAAAMYKSEAGPVVYRPQRCLGCRYCQIACPFEVPAFDWANPFTPKISKCWFCFDRQQAGEEPACVEACPTGALRFGQRDALLAQAHGLIASMPDRYVDHVFGEHEVGGTSMLYISDVPFEQLGFPTQLGDEPPPMQSEKVMRALPGVILGASALAAGTAYYTHRTGPHEEESESDHASGEIADQSGVERPSAGTHDEEE